MIKKYLSESDKNGLVRVLIGISFVILLAQFLQFFNSRKIDRDYREIIHKKNNVIHACNSILIHSSVIQRALLNLMFITDSTEIVEQKQRLINAEKNNANNLAIIEKSLNSKDEKEALLLKEIKQANLTYQEAYRNFLSYMSLKEEKKILEYRARILRPALDLYQQKHQELVTKLMTDTIDESTKISKYTKSSGWTLLLLGVSPYLLVGLALISLVFKIVRLILSK